MGFFFSKKWKEINPKKHLYLYQVAINFDGIQVALAIDHPPWYFVFLCSFVRFWGSIKLGLQCGIWIPIWNPYPPVVNVHSFRYLLEPEQILAGLFVFLSTSSPFFQLIELYLVLANAMTLLDRINRMVTKVSLSPKNQNVQSLLLCWYIICFKLHRF